MRLSSTTVNMEQSSWTEDSLIMKEQSKFAIVVSGPPSVTSVGVLMMPELHVLRLATLVLVRDA